MLSLQFCAISIFISICHLNWRKSLSLSQGAQGDSCKRRARTCLPVHSARLPVSAFVVCPSRCVCMCPSLSLWVSLCVCIPLSLSPCVCVFVVAAWPTTTRKTPPSCVVSSGEFRWGEVVVDITEVLVALPQTGLPLSHSLALPANYPALSLFLAHSPTLSLCASARSLGLAKKTTRQNEFQLRANFCCAWTSLRAKKKPLEVNPNPKLESRTSKLESRISKRSKRVLEISARKEKNARTLG